MNLDDLTGIILEQQQMVQRVDLVQRNYQFEENINYVLFGLRRAGKSYSLFQRIQKLIQNGIDPRQIIYLNFEDERLIHFNDERPEIP